MFRSFLKKNQPDHFLEDGKYENRTVNIWKSYFVDLFDDLQKFSKSLRTIMASNYPTRVDQENAFSMEIALDTGKCNGMDYNSIKRIIKSKIRLGINISKF